MAFAVGLGVQGPGKGFQGYEWELCKKKSDLNPLVWMKMDGRNRE